MSTPTDRQRIGEFPGVFAPSDPDQAKRAAADIAALREDLRAACLEPLADLAPQKQQAILRRLDRIGKSVMAGWPSVSTAMCSFEPCLRLAPS